MRKVTHTTLNERFAALLRVAVMSLGAALLTSCASPLLPVSKATKPSLPAEARFNAGAGHGNHLFLTLRRENGEPMLFAVDTGSPGTILDKSLEPELGERLDSGRVNYPAFGKTTVGIYPAPRLYLGNTQLSLGDRVWTDDLRRKFPGHPIMGILGMDCLQHYCIQLDFASATMRFLDPGTTSEALGKPVPLDISEGFITVNVEENFLGVAGMSSLIDTGCFTDGALTPKLFQQALNGAVSTNRWRAPSGAMRCEACFSNATFAGETYSDLVVADSPDKNVIGLRFLARHLITFNFPKRVMYLQRREAGSIPATAPVTEAVSFVDSDSYRAHVFAAPNLQPLVEDAFSEAFWWSPPEFVAVSPGVKLRVMELPAGNYHMRIGSTVVRDVTGVGLSVDYSPEPRGPTVPVRERGTVLLLHDYASRKESLSPWAYVLAGAGYRVLLVDLRGHGESTGQTISCGKYELADLQKVLDARVGHASKVGILGVGYGAALGLHLAAHDQRIGTVIAIAPWNEMDQSMARVAAGAKLPVTASQLKEAFVLEAAHLKIHWPDWSSTSAVRRVEQPVFLIGGADDAITSPEDFEALRRIKPSRSSSLLIAEANHRTIGYWFHELERPVKAWLEEKLPATSHRLASGAALKAVRPSK